MLKKIKNFVLVGLASLSISGCSYVPKNSDLEIYAKELYQKDFGNIIISPKGYEVYSMGISFQYRSKRCFFMFGNYDGDLWLPFLRLARERIGEEAYKLRRKKYPFEGGMKLYEIQEFTKICLDIDSNSVNGNNDKVAHPKETMGRLEQILPGATIDSLKLDLRNEFFNTINLLN